MRSRTFGQAFGGLLVFWVIMDIIFGFIRNPLDDRWVGKVEIATLSKVQQLDVTMTYEMLDPGFVMSRRPDVDRPGVRITYEGPDADVLRKMNIKADLFASPDRWQFSQGYCNFHIEKKLGWQGASYIGGPEVHMYAMRYMTQPKDPCDTFELGVVDFNHLDFKILRQGDGRYSMGGIDYKDLIHVSLERDSRLSFIQRMIMRMRFGSWLEHPTFQKDDPNI
ncbi:UNVERIFIED_ORG: hypothetical protein J2W87_001416 [Pseudomonas putida]|nr:hypothetical protein [Pseudomonas putida]